MLILNPAAIASGANAMAKLNIAPRMARYEPDGAPATAACTAAAPKISTGM